ncbi:type IV secretory system conjugative DNA transfer family protein, partial [Staphylococcus epidermidis]|uniref:type IV secretory system conjugative DNA transfer family protein n=1 Tax=Staphylococcus epidermidis TaxID=1282 RepID=UPI001642AEC7
HSGFHLPHVGLTRTVIYLIFPLFPNTLQSLSTLFFSQMFQHLYTLPHQNAPTLPLPLHFLLHQCPNIPPIPHYQQTLPTCPNYAITITTILQSIS